MFKKVLILILVSGMTAQLQAQDFFDIVKVSQNFATLGNLDNERETQTSNTNIELYYPFPLSSKVTVLGGFTYENTRLGLNFGRQRDNLIMTRVNLGAKIKHGKGWSGNYLVLPKLASDFNGTSDNDFQVGGLALLEKRLSVRKTYKFGTYVSSENFGTIFTPLVGLWYVTRNRKLTVNAILPIRSDIRYNISETVGVGANLITSVKSYAVNSRENDLYVQEESIRFSLFAQHELIDDQLVLRAKIGLDTTDYGLYNIGDEIGAQVLTFELGGDDRNRLNSEFDTGLFFGFDLFWRTGL